MTRTLLALLAAFAATAIAFAARWEIARERRARIEAELQNAGIPTA